MAREQRRDEDAESSKNIPWRSNKDAELLPKDPQKWSHSEIKGSKKAPQRRVSTEDMDIEIELPYIPIVLVGESI